MGGVTRGCVSGRGEKGLCEWEVVRELCGWKVGRVVRGSMANGLEYADV